MKKHYLEENGSRWYVKINNKSDELNIRYLIQKSKFPYYVVFNWDTGIEAVYPSLKRLKEDEKEFKVWHVQFTDDMDICPI